MSGRVWPTAAMEAHFRPPLATCNWTGTAMHTTIMSVLQTNTEYDMYIHVQKRIYIYMFRKGICPYIAPAFAFGFAQTELSIGGCRVATEHLPSRPSHPANQLCGQPRSTRAVRNGTVGMQDPLSHHLSLCVKVALSWHGLKGEEGAKMANVALTLTFDTVVSLRACVIENRHTE